MTRTKRTVAVAFAAALAGLASAAPAQAYDYAIAALDGSTINWIWLRTVSAFCSSRTWTGQAGPRDPPVRMSSASICLVDRIEMKGTNFEGRGLRWALGWTLPFGVTSGAFVLNNPQDYSAPACFTYEGTGSPAFCGGEINIGKAARGGRARPRRR